ncbi:hypothetical protein [Thermocrinis minervae]|uniref:Uncharacterized protein n=1 Tax=Thermocrinis minervae TaxID=381751 RepID=A0A1M6SYL3_9AQUI|nr:hypothetical protein [Thermocrinis minervae]SHK49783.1 hypothetical protein SAMN05444391_1221 [Thermocrinis minervae]
MRRVCEVLAFIILLFLNFLNPLYAETIESVGENTEHLTEFICGNAIVKVLTHCVYCEDLPPFCVSDKQYIVLKNILSDRKQILLSSSPTYAGEKYAFLNKEKVKGKRILQYLIVEVSCYKAKTDNKYYIELSYYNGGNCEQCEYFELYNDEGKLILTDREKIFYKPKSFQFNKILKKYALEYKKFKLEGIKNLEINPCRRDKS